MKYRKCDICHEKPIEIFFNSSELFIEFRCKKCRNNKCEINKFVIFYRFIRNIIIPYKGYSC